MNLKLLINYLLNLKRGGPLTTGRVTTGFDNGPVERGTFDDKFYTNSHLSKISVQN